MASKQYISIIRLFIHCDIATGDDFNLARTKKQLQAEFNIAQGGIIEVDGHAYTRHDVMEEIERPDFSKRLLFHKQIWASAQLIDLLENNEMNVDTIRPEFHAFWSNKEFDQFFSPYFTGPFAYNSRQFLSARQLRRMGELLNYEDFLQAEDREEALRPIRLFLEENLRILRNVNKENYTMMRPQFEHWIDRDWAGFLNNLPHEFYDEKLDIVTRLVNLGVAVQKSNREDCRNMSKQLILLQALPESLSGTISSNHEIYHKSTSFSWKGGWAIVWVIFIAIRLASSGGCDSSSRKSEFTPLNFKFEKVDSGYRIVKSPDYEGPFDTLATPAKVEVEASFKGGDKAWRNYLERNLNANIPVDNGAPVGTYTVFVQFMVKKDGSISDVKALTNHGYGMEAEAVRVVKKGAAWIPAVQDGRNVNAYRKQPITFEVTDE